MEKWMIVGAKLPADAVDAMGRLQFVVVPGTAEELELLRQAVLGTLEQIHAASCGYSELCKIAGKRHPDASDLQAIAVPIGNACEHLKYVHDALNRAFTASSLENGGMMQ